MANTLVTPSWITKETSIFFLNEVRFIANCDRQYNDEFIQSGAKVGNTVNVRLPQRFTATYGQALQLQSIYDQTVPLPLQVQIQEAFSYSSAEATTELDLIRDRYIMPAAESLANAADVWAYAQVYKSVYSAVGSPGVTPATTLAYLQAGVKLTDLATPKKDRVAVLDPLAMALLANTSATLFNPPKDISGNYKAGVMGVNQLGVEEWWEDQNRPMFTTGSFTTCTPTVNGANQTGSTLNTQAWASGATTLNAGDIITIAGVNSVNPLSYQSTGRLQQFVVTATTSDSSGNITALPISPSIITSGQLQTVDSSPASGAAITVWSANPVSGALTATNSPQSLLFHREAFSVVFADLVPIRAGAECEFVRSAEYGISIRMVEQYQIGTDQNPIRLDILMGAAPIQPRLACRIVG